MPISPLLRWITTPRFIRLTKTFACFPMFAGAILYENPVHPCQGPRDIASGTTTASLASLTAGWSHTHGAYDKTGCNSADEIASVSITTTTQCSS